MRRYLLLLALALPAAGILATGPPIQWAEAQKPKGEPEQPDDEPAAPEKLGKLTLTFDAGWHTDQVHKVLFTPDGQVITLSADHSIRIWDPDTKEMLKVLYPPGFLRPDAAALSTDGKRLALASAYPEEGQVRHVIYILTLPEGQIERVLRGHSGTISAVAFSPDGKRLASGSGGIYSGQKGVDSTLRLWNLDKEEAGQVLHKVQPGRLCFSPDGSRLVCVGGGKGEIIDLATGKKPAPLVGYKTAGDVHGVDWSSDGKTLATMSFKEVILWDADGKLRLLLPPTGYPSSVLFNRDSRTLLVTWNAPVYNMATLFDVHTGNKVVEFSPDKKVAKAFERRHVTSGAVSPDGQLMVMNGASTYVCKTQNGALHKAWVVNKWLRPGAAWSADGKAVTCTSETFKKAKMPTFHLSDLEFGQPLTKDAHGPVQQQGAWSLKKTSSGDLRQVLKNGKLVPWSTIPFPSATLVSKDRVALAGGGTGLRERNHPPGLYDANTGKLIRRFPHPSGIIHSGIAASPDERFFLTVGRDETMRIWNLEREKPLLLTLYMSGKDWIIWTPEGYYAATPGGERLMGWKLDNGIDQMPTYYAAERFRKQLYRPDVIKLLLEKGNLEDALETANAILRKEGTIVPAGIANPNKLLPPRAFLQILEKKALPKITVKASAVASVPNQPVTVLRLLVDGRPLPDRAAYAEGKTEAVWDITLPPGKHHLTVLARSPDASSVSESVEIDVIAAGKQAVLHVLAVGINDYEDKTLKLEFAAKDARDVATAFKNSKGGLFRDVLSQPLVNADARRDIILKQLADLRKKADPNDLVVVFFAGHGVKDKDKFYLLTVEARTNDLARTAISGEDLRKSLGEFPCQVLLMLDACHSSGGIKNFRPAVDDITRNLTDDECGVAVLCAAMAHEKALEKSGNGLFTRAVVQALQGGKNVPHRNQLLYVHHLHGFVLDEVATLSNDQQHPFLSLPWVVESFPVTPQFAANANK